MTKCWSQTLESLDIYQSHLIKSSDIQLILTTCPKLKKFTCICYWVLITHQPGPGEETEHHGLEAMIRGDENINNQQPLTEDWVCLELEKLALTFSDGRRRLVEEEALFQQEQWTIRGIIRVYQQLGRLTRLKNLIIGWYSGSTFSDDANLDLSLESGLGHMNELKSLRMIDMNYIPRVKIKGEEVEWMLANWPALRTINGLRHRGRMVEGNTQEPNPVELLSSGRSWLSIS